MKSLNYGRAVDTARKAYEWAGENAHIAALNAQTFATLALVDLLGDKTTPPWATWNEIGHPDSAVVPAPNGIRTEAYVIAGSPQNALKQYQKGQDLFQFHFEAAEVLQAMGNRDLEIYKVSVEVVHS